MDYNGIRVLVTGADGFIGSHLVEQLVKAGARVTALSYYNSFNYWGWLEDVTVKDKIRIISGDIRDYAMMQKICTETDIIFHLAALIAIPYSYHAPESYFETNVKGTMHICQAALEKGVKRIVHTSTSEVYGTAQYVPIDEDHPLQPQSPYSASKIGADALAKSFHYSFNLPLVIARPFNTYGPRQSARAVIPTIITQLLNGAKTIRLGNITPTRDFNYVLDTCQGLMLLGLHKEAEGEIFNIGSGHEHSIRDTFSTIVDILKADASLVEDEVRIRPEKSEVYRLLAKTDKIEKLTGYKPEYSYERGLEETINWFRLPENRKRYKPEIYNV